jgi:hypothetical protein
MRCLKAVTLVLVLLPTLAFAQKKAKKPAIPAAIDQARSVYVEAADGEEFNSNLPLGDRMAIADLRDALREWGRYTFTAEREKADLVFVVRKGRSTSAGARGGIGDGNDPITQPNSQGPLGQQGQRGMQNPSQQYPGQAQQSGPGFGAGGEDGFEDDVLNVCQLKPDGKLSTPLWSRSFAHGLDAPRLLLFAQFKDAVEKAYPITPPSTPAKP